MGKRDKNKEKHMNAKTGIVLAVFIVMAALVVPAMAAPTHTTVQTASVTMIGDRNSIAVSGNVAIGATDITQGAHTTLAGSRSSLVGSINLDLGVPRTTQEATTTAIGIYHSAGGSVNIAVP